MITTKQQYLQSEKKSNHEESIKESSNGNNIIRLKKIPKLLNLYLQVILESKSPE